VKKGKGTAKGLRDQSPPFLGGKNAALSSQKRNVFVSAIDVLLREGKGLSYKAVGKKRGRPARHSSGGRKKNNNLLLGKRTSCQAENPK